MAKSQTKTLAFVASGSGQAGSNVLFSVYETGNSFEVVRTNPHYRHFCHPSVRSYEDVKNEIVLVFGVSVTDVKYPFELNARTRPDSEETGA